MQSSRAICSLIEVCCQADLVQLDLPKTLDGLVARQDNFDAALKDYDWYKNYLSNYLTAQQSSPEVKVKSSQLLSGWDVTLIQIILQKLSEKSDSKSTSFRQHILNFCRVNIEAGKNYNFIIMKFLQDAGLLSAIQYVICISLLTGGENPAQLGLKLVVKLLKDANLRWEDILGNDILFNHYELAMENDNPIILLSLLETDKFNLSNLNTTTQINQNLINFIIDNNKINILKKVINDLSAEDLLNLKCFHKILKIQNESIIDAINNKVTERSQYYNNSKQFKINNLLMSMKDHIDKCLCIKDYPEAWKAYSKSLLSAIDTEIKNSYLNLYEGIFNSYIILINALHKINLGDMGSLHHSFPEHSIVQPNMIQGTTTALMDSLKIKLKQATGVLEKKLNQHPENFHLTLDCFNQWLDIAITYQNKKNDKKEYSPIQFVESHRELGYVLERIRISAAAYALGLRNLPDFIIDMLSIQDIHGLKKNKGSLMAAIEVIKVKLFAFLHLHVSVEANNSIKDIRSENKTLDQLRVISHQWGMDPLQQEDRISLIKKMDQIIRDKVDGILLDIKDVKEHPHAPFHL